jgi:hypothetical protein
MVVAASGVDRYIRIVFWMDRKAVRDEDANVHTVQYYWNIKSGSKEGGNHSRN